MNPPEDMVLEKKLFRAGFAAQSAMLAPRDSDSVWAAIESAKATPEDLLSLLEWKENLLTGAAVCLAEWAKRRPEKREYIASRYEKWAIRTLLYPNQVDLHLVKTAITIIWPDRDVIAEYARGMGDLARHTELETDFQNPYAALPRVHLRIKELVGICHACEKHAMPEVEKAAMESLNSLRADAIESCVYILAQSDEVKNREMMKTVRRVLLLLMEGMDLPEKMATVLPVGLAEKALNQINYKELMESIIWPNGKTKDEFDSAYDRCRVAAKTIMEMVGKTGNEGLRTTLLAPIWESINSIMQIKYSNLRRFMGEVDIFADEELFDTKVRAILSNCTTDNPYILSELIDFVTKKPHPVGTTELKRLLPAIEKASGTPGSEWLQKKFSAAYAKVSRDERADALPMEADKEDFLARIGRRNRQQMRGSYQTMRKTAVR